jgi:hypothetical protein
VRFAEADSAFRAFGGPPWTSWHQHFTLLGIEFQWWMPIVGSACALYVLWLRATGQFRDR